MGTMFYANGRPNRAVILVRSPSRRQIAYAEALRTKTGTPLPKEWSMPAYQRYIAEQLRILEVRNLELLRNDDL